MDASDPWVVVREKIEDYDFAWVFYWTPRSLLHRKRNPPITGNYPIIVTKDDGQMYICAGPYPPRHFISLLQSTPERISGLRISLPEE